MNYPYFHLTAALVMASPALSSRTHAAVYFGSALEQFAYSTANNPGDDTADGDLVNNNAGTGWNATGTGSAGNTAWVPGSAAAVNITAGSLAYPGLATVGNKVSLDATGGTSQQVLRGLGQTLDSGTFYLSFLLQRDFTSFRNLTLTFFGGVGEKFQFGQIGAAANSLGDIAVYANNSTLLTSAAPIALGTGTAHLLVTRIDFNDSGVNERIRFYVDPVVGSLEPGAAYIDNSAFDFGTIDTIRIFAGGTNGAFSPPTASGSFDEIRTGATWGAVVVPEPGAAALGALALLGLTRRRRMS